MTHEMQVHLTLLTVQCKAIMPDNHGQNLSVLNRVQVLYLDSSLGGG